jgi:hypothetical protein
MPRNLIPHLMMALTLSRWRWALLIATLSDGVGFGLTMVPPIRWLLDAITAVVLFAVLGFRWPLLSALAIEAVPALQVFPAWILVVVALASTEARALLQDAHVADRGD